LSDMAPEIRFRFTSPHPKDFPTEVLHLIAAQPNICSSLHLPFQSGSSTVLERMRRGYTREAYLELIARAKDIIGSQVTFSTDVIAGFCGETEEEHKQSVQLMRDVKFDQAFMFAYSLRDKTHAAHAMKDDVEEIVKNRRLQEIIEAFRSEVQKKNETEIVGTYQLVLVEGLASKSREEFPMLTGRDDGNRRIVFPAKSFMFESYEKFKSMYSEDVLGAMHGSQDEIIEGVNGKEKEVDIANSMGKHRDIYLAQLAFNRRVELSGGVKMAPPYNELVGTYVVVKILKANSTTLRGIGVAKSAIGEFK
jgi:radical SAM superfamily enzyme YgiQ (UPF0313 family)